MRVVIYAADKGGCGYYRCVEPARTCGVDCDVRYGGIERRGFGTIRNGVRNIEGFRPTDTDMDVVVLHRPPSAGLIEALRRFQEAGVAVVIEVDDDYTIPHYVGRNRQMEGAEHPAVHARNVGKACALADLVTVTTPALAARYGAHGRIAVLPNCVPASLLDLPRDSDGRTLGWSGSVANHPGDLDVTHGGVADAVERARWRFHLVGPDDGVSGKLGLRDMSDTGWLHDINDYHRALGALDVGVVPLADTAFNDCKSGLKGLEMAARGVPFVASPVPSYVQLAGEGIGTLCPDRGRNWRSNLLRLMGDESLRAETAHRGCAKVRENHLYEHEGWRWAEAWDRAIANRRATEGRHAAAMV